MIRDMLVIAAIAVLIIAVPPVDRCLIQPDPADSISFISLCSQCRRLLARSMLIPASVDVR